MPAPRRRSGVIAIALSLAVAASTTLLAGAAGAQGAAPSIRLVTGSTSMTVTRSPGRKAYLGLAVYVAAVGGAFEIRATRADYDHPVSVFQVVNQGGSVTTNPLPAWIDHDWQGLAKFLHVTVTDAAGTVILDRYHPFCPGSGDLARLNDDGPDVPTYPQSCGGNPFQLGAVWGIDDGWAANAFGYANDAIKGPDGHYTATVSIAPKYQSLFDVTPSDASVSIDVTVKTSKHNVCAPFCSAASDRAHDARRPNAPGASTSRSSVPILTSPDPSIMPDLVALPAWGITLQHDRRTRRDFLDFGATIWDKGPSPMDIEGFRQPGKPTMDAWEYFYSNGIPVGRAQAGTMTYDALPGHQHWHFEQFARYTLLDANQQTIVRSRKTGFCLAPTDAIDLTVPNALWTPYSIGLSTACGGEGALWVREALPVGWGDTYYQSLPGQSFDITDLPNGTYYIQIAANPAGLLMEGSTMNNTEIRRVVLGGRPGHRTLRVPAWHGIDPEPGAGGGGGVVPTPVP
ncbi:MAG: lysyl oxidase family protein [Actinomycetota bacterium]